MQRALRIIYSAVLDIIINYPVYEFKHINKSNVIKLTTYRINTSVINSLQVKHNRHTHLCSDLQPVSGIAFCYFHTGYNEHKVKEEV